MFANFQASRIITIYIFNFFQTQKNDNVVWYYNSFVNPWLDISITKTQKLSF